MLRGSRRRYLALAAIVGLVAGCTVAATAVAAGASGRPQTRLSPAEREILKIALRAAARTGDPRPTLIQYSLGTRGKANLISSKDITGGEQRSYLIAERGHFVLRDLGIGNQTVRGSVITVVLNASTLHSTDFGLQDNYPNLAALGRVTTLRRASR
jgi:hypothetical protein